MKTIKIPVDDIWPPDVNGDGKPLGPIDKKKVRAIAESFKEMGQKVPISVRRKWDAKETRQFVIVAGRHRHSGAELLGWDSIECVIENGSEIDAELWQCSENLHRTNMTPRAEALQTERWKEIRKAKAKELISLQNGEKSNQANKKKKKKKKKKKTNKNPKGAGRASNPGSIPETAKALGIGQAEVVRREKIAKMDSDAAAILDKLPETIKATQADYLHVASKPKAEQVKAAESLAARKESEHQARKTEGRKPKVNPISKAWDNASDADRDAFMSEKGLKHA
jgi:ParB family chromosome partitioning protein